MKFRATFEFEAESGNALADNNLKARLEELQQYELLRVVGFNMRLTKLEQEEILVYYKEVEKAIEGVDAFPPRHCNCDPLIVTTQRDVKGYHHSLACSLFRSADV